MVAERTRSRLFLDELATRPFREEFDTDDNQFFEEESQLLTEVEKIQTWSNAGDILLSVEEQLQSLKWKLENIWKEISLRFPTYVALRRGETIEYKELRGILKLS